MQDYYMTPYGGYELYHSGIKGMKWGIRRYQNEDGSLTEEGKKRYATLTGKIEKQQRKIDKWQAKVDRQSGKYYRAEKKRAKAAKIKDRAMNSWFMSEDKRMKYILRADRLNAQADRMQSNALKNAAKIRRAQAKINKYARKIAKFAPESTYAGAQFINGQYQKKLSSIG